MLHLLLTFFSFFTLLLHQPLVSHSVQELKEHNRPQKSSLSQSNHCNETCGNLIVPFPFYLNSSCRSVSSAFHLSCSNSTSLYLSIDSQGYRIIEFFSDGLLLDFPGNSSTVASNTCRQYDDFSSFGFAGNEYFGISGDNVLGLYDCEDSSLCKADCETIDLPGCSGNGSGGSNNSPACCYPLSDHSMWDFGEGFSEFSSFGCRGFSCWVVARGRNTGQHGVKLEWAIPGNQSIGVCDSNANVVDSTAVDGGVRCACQDGFVGDGFANGTGCLKACIKDSHQAYGTDCYSQKHGAPTITILAGVLGPIFVIVSLVALLCLMKRPAKSATFNTDQAHFHSSVSFKQACRMRLFAYNELEEATKGFHDSQKLVDNTNGAIYAGVLGDGSHAIIHKVRCQHEREAVSAQSHVRVLSAAVHRNLARLLGLCIDFGLTQFVVYEYHQNGTLEDHLQQRSTRGQKAGLDWYKRLNIAAEIASILAFLLYEISPPICHHDLKSGFVFLDEEFSVKLAGFRLVNELHQAQSNDVYDFGLLLLEIITGSKHNDLQATTALQKIRSGKIEEIVDPSLYYHEQPPFRREQIQAVADVATRCLLFGLDGKIGMVDVARELVHATKESIDGCSKRRPALEETFSNSSLLQMISMSPDSIYVP